MTNISEVDSHKLAMALRESFLEHRNIEQTYKEVAVGFGLQVWEVSDFDKENRITDQLAEYTPQGYQSPNWATKLGAEPPTPETAAMKVEKRQGRSDIVSRLISENKVVETNQPDFICTGPLYDSKRERYFRECFEWEGGKWEGFISFDPQPPLGMSKEQLGDTTPISGAGQQALQSSLKIGSASALDPEVAVVLEALATGNPITKFKTTQLIDTLTVCRQSNVADPEWTTTIESVLRRKGVNV